jgi:hypothetical protein
VDATSGVSVRWGERLATRARKSFVAYPSGPVDLVSPIQKAVIAAQISRGDLKIVGWENLAVFGSSIPESVRQEILSSDVVVCDITHPNSNVYYEAGFAIGAGKSVAPVLNTSFANSASEIQRDGIFDNIGYRSYENSEQLTAILLDLPTSNLVELYSRPVNFQQPLFVLDTFRKTDFRNAVVSAVKNAGVFYRSFDPAEIPRLSTVSILGDITASAGVVIPILAPHIDDAARHNLRAALVAGLSHGLSRSTLLIELSREDGSDPADYRELISYIHNPDAIDETVQAFAKAAVLAGQTLGTARSLQTRSSLQKLSLGASAAENEFRTLESYFVETSEFLRTVRGEVNIVAGRKGSGKTAIFFQVRDRFRQSKSTTVVDLKPESHQLSLFREELLKTVDTGVFDHTLAAFWYYVILTEVIITIKRDYERRSRNNSEYLSKSLAISNLLDKYEISETGDFTSRITRLASLIVQDIKGAKSKGEKLTADRLTNMIFHHGISNIKNAILEYTASDNEIVFLFDNIDKGWPANGVHEFDVRLVRLLIESLDKVRRDFHVQHREFLSVVFLRNDIYELMVEATPDRGKAGQARIDWNDRAKLRQVIYRRLQASTGEKSRSFEELWSTFFVDKVGNNDSFDYFVDHCLMRPRFLINILENAIANGINRDHARAEDEDCRDAVDQHSNYLVNDFGYEIRDVSGIQSDILYSLVGSPDLSTRGEITDRFKEYGLSDDDSNHAFQLMLWYGVVGFIDRNNARSYIYDFAYDMKRLEAELRQLKDDVLYVLNPAFHFH